MILTSPIKNHLLINPKADASNPLLFFFKIYDSISDVQVFRFQISVLTISDVPLSDGSIKVSLASHICILTLYVQSFEAGHQ
ncbi:hypothetical protein L1987_00420 [Smallanthus sonchifolius]|uniref:Uncharacterized protein n=1 Tax=Smallanthus sonchifolius TaxID=185202 RepID=A0ACB9K299_9ASTR|nr:hypothetical protein L1987_00420 [Smallanthus sonchifolius]